MNLFNDSAPDLSAPSSARLPWGEKFRELGVGQQARTHKNLECPTVPARCQFGGESAGLRQ